MRREPNTAAPGFVAPEDLLQLAGEFSLDERGDVLLTGFLMRAAVETRLEQLLLATGVRLRKRTLTCLLKALQHGRVLSKRVRSEAKEMLWVGNRCVHNRTNVTAEAVQERLAMAAWFIETYPEPKGGQHVA